MRISTKTTRKPSDSDDYTPEFQRMVDHCKEKVALYEHSARLADREEAGKWRARLRRWEMSLADYKAKQATASMGVEMGISEIEPEGGWGEQEKGKRKRRVVNPGFGSD